jgi:hypothetical protein
MILGVDFDETLAEQHLDLIVEVPQALYSMQVLKDRGCKLMLHTNRCGFPLEWAIGWCAERGLYFDAVNRSVYWWQRLWFAGPKPYADFWLDDRNPGTNLIYRPFLRPIIDWPAYLPVVLASIDRARKAA